MGLFNIAQYFFICFQDSKNRSGLMKIDGRHDSAARFTCIGNTPSDCANATIDEAPG
jgi:hypothetical protein